MSTLASQNHLAQQTEHDAHGAARDEAIVRLSCGPVSAVIVVRSNRLLISVSNGPMSAFFVNNHSAHYWGLY